MTNSPKYFIQIPVDTASQCDIQPVDKLVFGEVYTMLNTTDKFFMSSQHLSERIGVNRSTVIRSIKRLVDKGYVKTKINIHNDNKSKRFIYDPKIVGSSRMHPPVVAKRNNSSSRMHPPVVAKRNPNRLSNISVNKQRETTQVNRDSVYLHNEFQKIFACDGAKVGMAINGWLVDNTKDQILNAMKNTKARCRVGNPNAIISYINAVIKYPMKPKKRNSTNHRGDSNDSKYNHKARF